MLDKGCHLIEEVLLENVLPRPNDAAPLLGVARSVPLALGAAKFRKHSSSYHTPRSTPDTFI